MRSIRDAYYRKVNMRRSLGEGDEVNSLPERERGRSKLLGNDLDGKVQLYIKSVRDHGGVVSSGVVMAAARGILLSCAKEKLVEFGGHIDLNRHWAFSLLKRMNSVKRKDTTSKSKYSIENFAKAKNSFLKSITKIVAIEEIPPELVLNWDQTGLNIVPSSFWTMDQRGQKRIELIGLKNKRQITAVFCCSIQGAFLPLQVIL